MKKVVVALALAGCARPIPPQAPPVTVIEMRPIVAAKTYGQVVSVEVDDNPYEEETEPVRSTWLTGEALQQVLDERHEKAIAEGKECRQGDPLCSILP